MESHFIKKKCVVICKQGTAKTAIGVEHFYQVIKFHMYFFLQTFILKFTKLLPKKKLTVFFFFLMSNVSILRGGFYTSVHFEDVSS